GYLLLFPKARVDVLIIFIIFFKIFPIPAWIVLGVWFSLQLLNGIGSASAGGGVAYWAHVGGFMIGLGLMLAPWRRRGGKEFWVQNRGRPSHPETRYAHSLTSIPRIKRRK
ncbi:MAG: rhomboid family intramembrane serine protease, partial [Paracoccaceae bacterium]